jgi:hypothetical protein
MGRTVRLTVVPDEGAAVILCGMLRSEGIQCTHRPTDMAQGAWDGAYGFAGWREVLVDSDDLERAGELIPRPNA